jgi:hypothetical protein
MLWIVSEYCILRWLSSYWLPIMTILFFVTYDSGISESSDPSSWEKNLKYKQYPPSSWNGCAGESFPLIPCSFWARCVFHSYFLKQATPNVLSIHCVFRIKGHCSLWQRMWRVKLWQQ